MLLAFTPSPFHQGKVLFIVHGAKSLHYILSACVISALQLPFYSELGSNVIQSVNKIYIYILISPCDN